MSEEALDGPNEEAPSYRSDAWTDLGLTLPFFVAYHLCVVFLPFRNAADPLTPRLRSLANASIPSYCLFTILIGALFAGVIWLIGRRRAFSGWRFLFVACEGLLYAAVLRFAASYLLGALPLSAPTPAGGGDSDSSVFSGVVMSLGAGFYEEIAFRVVLYGTGAWVVNTLMDGGWGFLLKVLWAAVTATLFSAWHYTGQLGEAFDVHSFVYRAICGFILTMVFALRGFAPAVWTHALYDVWALVLAGG